MPYVNAINTVAIPALECFMLTICDVKTSLTVQKLQNVLCHQLNKLYETIRRTFAESTTSNMATAIPYDAR